MVEEGLFERFPMRAVYGMHNMPKVRAGSFALREGPLMGAYDIFEIVATGKGAHAAMAYQGKDPMLFAAHAIHALQTIVSRNLHPLDAGVVSVTQVHAGDTWNVIPEQIVLRGTVRSFKRDVQDLIEQRMHTIVAGIAATFDMQATLRYERRYPATVNSAEETTHAARAAAAVVGDTNIDRNPMPEMAAEDFADKAFPIDPATYPLIFEPLGNIRDFRTEAMWNDSEYPELQTILRGFRELAPHDTTDQSAIARRQQEIPLLKQQLAILSERSQHVRELMEEALRRANGDPADPRSFDALHRILELQAYRLAHWRVSAEEINYRRFFDINDLVGLRMENPSVFAATHRLIRKLLGEGLIDGLRLDHPDGLFNPVQYFTRIQMLYAASRCCGPEPKGRLADNGIEQDMLSLFSSQSLSQQAPMYVLVEKILEAGEHLPPDWPVDGTVGYEFGNSLNHLFINSRTQRYFTNFYHRFVDGLIDTNNLIYESKMLIMRSSLSSELTVLTHMLEEIGSSDRRARDITRALLKDAIRTTVACFPVYRTYIDERGTVSERDRAYIAEAIVRAKRRNQNESPAVYDFLRAVLLLDTGNGNISAEQYRKRLQFTLKFQQLTGPVMAKGLEDTACYVYSRFISVNEVGGSPAQFGISIEEFHHGNQERAKNWPNSMLSTSTHDSKRGEDVRARLNVLSEMPKQWSAQVIRWRRANRSKKRTLGDGRMVPDANEEYFLYQTLLGAWPLEMEDDTSREDFTRRTQEYMAKAVREAKVNLSWINQNQEYVDTLNHFIERILTPGTPKRQNPFLHQFESFLKPLQFFGAVNG